MNIKAFFLPRVIRFVLISAIRLLGIVAICMSIGAEVHEIVRNIQGYSAALKTSHAHASGNGSHTANILNNSTSAQCGYVQDTTVPNLAGAIFFSTFFRFMNVIVLLFLLVSEISPPWRSVTDFYLHNFNSLSDEASVGFLGIAMIWIATSILSSNVQQHAIISAWILFVMGILNFILGILMPSIRETRSIFAAEKSPRSVLPTTAARTKKQSKGVVSYPAPLDIGFPTPAAASKSSLAYGGAFDLGPQMAAHRPSVSETVERRAVTPTIQHGIHRSRSGKGVVTIRTDPDGNMLHHEPPSYGHGQAI
ncbi:MAG: hypothetical protein CYPHOPRED_001724 [Cyphobasidiales sp. Tagirdzhanova-0007]|nr:MAG: hypothetical protein CYPHOPRED_001724 [Cyphobasidiales sp. Tagirdzhanova-0007]